MSSPDFYQNINNVTSYLLPWLHYKLQYVQCLQNIICCCPTLVAEKQRRELVFVSSIKINQLKFILIDQVSYTLSINRFHSRWKWMWGFLHFFYWTLETWEQCTKFDTLGPVGLSYNHHHGAKYCLHKYHIRLFPNIYPFRIMFNTLMLRSLLLSPPHLPWMLPTDGWLRGMK